MDTLHSLSAPRTRVSIGDNTVGPGRRLAAAGIDWLLVALTLALLGAGLFPAAEIDDDLGLAMAVAAIGAYYVGLTWLIGGTPGKLLLGVEVVDETGHWLGIGRSLLRFAVWCCLPLLAWAFVLGANRRGLHDLIAGTYVVRAA